MTKEAILRKNNEIELCQNCNHEIHKGKCKVLMSADPYMGNTYCQCKSIYLNDRLEAHGYTRKITFLQKVREFLNLK